eukprot:29098-Pelagococcus_subviridis.AAC.3
MPRRPPIERPSGADAAAGGVRPPGEGRRAVRVRAEPLAREAEQRSTAELARRRRGVRRREHAGLHRGRAARGSGQVDPRDQRDGRAVAEDGEQGRRGVALRPGASRQGVRSARARRRREEEEERACDEEDRRVCTNEKY